MVKRIKFTQKQVKSPDEFRKSIARIIEFASDNYARFLIGLGIIVVIIVAVLSISIYRERQDLEANSRFQQAIGNYSSGDVEAALSELKNIKDNYPDCQISDIALYYIGVINLENGKYDEAISSLDEFLRTDETDATLRDAAHYKLGVANFKKGMWQSAIDSSLKLNSEESPYKKQAQLLSALAFEKQGKRSEAEKIYQELLTGFPANNLSF